MLHSFSTNYSVDGWPAVALQFSLVIIVLGYLVIAFQFWLARKHKPAGSTSPLNREELQHRARRAFLQLMLIFIFCAISGYFPRLIHFEDWLFVGVHLVLASATWWYILSRQAEIIAEAMSTYDRP